MFSKPLLVGAVAAGCVAAAASGAYVAVRHNAEEPRSAATAAAAPGQPAEQPAEAPRPVAETEAIVTSDAPAQKGTVDPQEPAAPATKSVTPERPASPAATPGRVGRPTSRPADPGATRRAASDGSPSTHPTRSRDDEPVAPAARPEARETAEAPREAAAPLSGRAEIADVTPQRETAAPVAQFEELVVPASSVIGLRVETPLSTERARPEDRVDARVTRDVMADGRVAVPAGSQAIGTVTLVERGGKIKERARLGVRFHTLVLADGTELPISTEAIYREGDAPAGESSRKIGGAAVGGAILGALIGGKKGAIVGGATGAAGGTAVVMAGDRNAATLPAGTIVTVRLAAPVAVDVQKR